MDRELLESAINGADALCRYCDNEDCDNCIVLMLVNDALDELHNMQEDNLIRSSTCRDYGPSNPWDAPGMSVKDFI